MGGIIGGIASLIGGLIGPSPQQTADINAQAQVGQNTANFFNQWTQNANTVFGENQALFNQVTGSLSPTLAAGPNQQGFSPEELAAMNTQAINTTGAAAKNAEQRLGNTIAGEGGGAIAPGQSGAANQLEASLASNEAGQLANTQNEITQQNYAQGQKNYSQALSGLEGEQQLENPNQYAQQATTLGQNAFSDYGQMASTQAQLSASKIAGIAGGIGGIAGGLIGLGS